MNSCFPAGVVYSPFPVVRVWVPLVPDGFQVRRKGVVSATFFRSDPGSSVNCSPSVPADYKSAMHGSEDGVAEADGRLRKHLHVPDGYGFQGLMTDWK